MKTRCEDENSTSVFANNLSDCIESLLSQCRTAQTLLGNNKQTKTREETEESKVELSDSDGDIDTDQDLLTAMQVYHNRLVTKLKKHLA